jgi:hypothetical protein
LQCLARAMLVVVIDADYDGFIRLTKPGLVARFIRTVKPLPEQDMCARYVRLVRFSFLILIGRFVTLGA